MRYLTSSLFLATTISALMIAPAYAEIVEFSADLSGKAEVPKTDSTGSGTLGGTLDTDTKEFVWTITYQGLSGPATAAHFHGPVGENANAAPVITIDVLDTPIAGNATLTDQQMTQLKDGLWYFNVHTAKFPDGEIRGQLKPSL